jgi:5-methyltetrahydrofolate--homocysteine methyltransferase
MTVSAEHNVGMVTLEAMKLVKEELGVNMTLGVSNISYGLPDREFVNHVFLAMAVQAGLTCAIIDPTVEEMKMAVLAADLLKGKDEWCENYLNAYREKLKKD